MYGDRGLLPHPPIAIQGPVLVYTDRITLCNASTQYSNRHTHTHLLSHEHTHTYTHSPNTQVNKLMEQKNSAKVMHYIRM